MSSQDLASRLSDADSASRARAAERLAQKGRGAQPAALALLKACGDDDEAVREWAAAALEELGPPQDSQLEPIAALLSAQNADIAYWAATLLGRLGSAAAPATAALVAALSGSPPLQVRQRAAWALGKIGPAAGEALPALRQAETSDDARLARLASQAISTIEAGENGGGKES